MDDFFRGREPIRLRRKKDDSRVSATDDRRDLEKSYGHLASPSKETQGAKSGPLRKGGLLAAVVQDALSPLCSMAILLLSRTLERASAELPMPPRRHYLLTQS